MSQQITIQSGVSVPPIMPSAEGRKPVYPLKQMKVGESFFIPLQGAKARGRVNSAACQFSIRHPGYFFTTRTVTEENIPGLRVWRVEEPVS